MAQTAEGDDQPQVDADIEALIQQKVAEAVATVLGKVQEQVASNTAGLEDLHLLVHGVGALLSDCVVKREEHFSGLL